MIASIVALALLATPAHALSTASERWQARHAARETPRSPRARALVRIAPTGAGRGLPVRRALAPPLAPVLAAAPALSGTGTISGAVVAASGEAPLAGVEVCAFTFVEGLFGGCGETDSVGDYEIAGLAGGEYVVEFFAAGKPRLLTQYYDGAGSEAEAQPVAVAEGAVTERINARLIEGGTVTGTVTSAKGAAIEGIEVCAESLTGLSGTGCARSGADGAYEVVGLASGEYLIEFSASTELDYAPEFYDGTSDRTKALPLSVSAGASTTGIDAVMHPGASVEGTVTDAASKEGIGGVSVCAFDPEKLVGRCARTQADGSYLIGSLAGGKVEVAFTARAQRGLNYADQFYDGRAKPEEADLVAVGEGSTTPGIDAALVEGGRIEGVVTSAASGLALEGASVCAFPIDPELGLRCEGTNAQGHYEIVGLSSESYVVGFFGPEGEYRTQYYDGASSEGGAQRLKIEAGTTRTGIDAALKLRAPSALSIPEIAGRAVEGQTLTVTHASWSGNPTAFVDEWGRCAGGCETVAQGSSYTLTAADVGATIVAREAAVNAGGQSPFAYSAPSEIVVMAARGGGTSPPPGGGVKPGHGVSGSTSSLPGVAELRALLRRLLTPAGSGAKIGALLRHGGYSHAFGALAGGQLTVSWYEVKGARSVLVARGHVSFAGAVSARLAISLTAKGRGLLRRVHRLKLLARGQLATAGQQTVRAERGFTLAR
jgi:hypothetical protein